MSSASKRQGFTLIELMIVVAILGILAAVAVPSFTFYLRRSKSVDAQEALRHMFQHVAAYYLPEQATRGVGGNLFAHCTIGSIDNGVTPGADKNAGNYSAPEWRALTFQRPYSYYRLEIDSSLGARCLVPASTAPIYALRAVGDLDGDSITSLFELTVGSSNDNELYHSRGFYIENEAE